MSDIRIVQGSYEASLPVVVNHNNVYLHFNKKQIIDPEYPDMDLWEFEEKVITKEEFIEYAANYINKFETCIAEEAAISDINSYELEYTLGELGMFIV